MRSVPSGQVACGSVAAPPSKSHAIRLLVTGALCPEGAVIRRLGLADDILHVLDVVHALGSRIDVENPRGGLFDARVACGRPGRELVAGSYDLGGSGTGLRLVAALCALGEGPFLLDGDASLRARPVGDIVRALRSLGVRVAATGGRPPLSISGGPVRGGRTVTIDGSRSSQGVSALLLLGGALPDLLSIEVEGPLVSAPYVDLTIRVLERAGARVRVYGDPREYRVCDGLGALDETVEGDWSAASYLLAAGAATGGRVAVDGLQGDSAQADRRIAGVLREFGAGIDENGGVTCSGRVVRPVDVDLADAPDLAPLVGALACLAPGRSRVRGAAHLRLKESDRIAATVAGARRLGFEAEEHDDGFSIVGGRRSAVRGPVDSCGDHRIAMSFAVAGLVLEGVTITQPGCVAKTYPEFWSDLTGLLGV